MSNHELDLLARIGARIDSFLGLNETRAVQQPQGTQTDSLIDIDKEPDANRLDDNLERENDDGIRANERRQVSSRLLHKLGWLLVGESRWQPTNWIHWKPNQI